MAELESEDSSDGTLVIDEPNCDDQTIEIFDDSDSDVEIVKLDKDTEENSDVEIVELDDDIEDTTALLNSSRSPIKRIGLICKVCSTKFSTNNELLNHIRKFIGRVGGCKNVTNVTFTAKRKNSENPNSEHLIKKKRGRPPKNIFLPPVPMQTAPASIAFPLRPRPSIPELIPIIFNSATNPTPTVATNDNILPSLRQILIDEMEPEYPCTICGEIFRHNIGLICHLDTEHNNDESTIKDANKQKKSSNKLVKRQYIKKNVVNNKQIEDQEPISDTVDLTLLPEFKKDSIMNRMKSYIHTTIKGQVICLLCNIDFKTTKKALSHIEDKHIMDKIGCGYCNLKFVYELKLRSHMAKRHKVICVYKCDKCLKMIKQEEFDSHSEKCKEKVNPIIIKREEDNI